MRFSSRVFRSAAVCITGGLPSDPTRHHPGRRLDKEEFDGGPFQDDEEYAGFDTAGSKLLCPRGKNEFPPLKFFPSFHTGYRPFGNHGQAIRIRAAQPEPIFTQPHSGRQNRGIFPFDPD